MAKITYPNKDTGDQFFATEANEIKTVVNGLDDAITALGGAPKPSGVSFSTAPGAPTVTNTGITETASVVNNNGTTVNIPSLLMSYALAAAGKKRRDAIVVDYLAGSPAYVRIAGTEVNNTDVVPTPSIPVNRLFVRYLDISDGAATAYQSELSAVTAALAGKLGEDAESGDYTLFIPHEGGRSKAIAFQGQTDRHTIDAVSNAGNDNTDLVITIGDNDEDNLIIRQVNSSAVSETIAKFNRLGIQFLKPLTDVDGNAFGYNKADKDLSINTQTASYTLALTDRGGLVRMNVASANTLTVPPNSAVAFPVGTQLVISQAGAGQTTVVAGSGVTINASGAKMKLTGQWSGATLIQVSANVWTLLGDLSA